MAKRSSNTATLEINNNDRLERPNQAQPLKIKLDHLKTFDALTANQQKFFDAYKRGDYFTALHGVAGTGKTDRKSTRLNSSH